MYIIWCLIAFLACGAPRALTSTPELRKVHTNEDDLHVHSTHSISRRNIPGDDTYQLLRNMAFGSFSANEKNYATTKQLPVPTEYPKLKASIKTTVPSQKIDESRGHRKHKSSAQKAPRLPELHESLRRHKISEHKIRLHTSPHHRDSSLKSKTPSIFSLLRHSLHSPAENDIYFLASPAKVNSMHSESKRLTPEYTSPRYKTPPLPTISSDQVKINPQFLTSKKDGFPSDVHQETFTQERDFRIESKGPRFDGLSLSIQIPSRDLTSRRSKERRYDPSMESSTDKTWMDNITKFQSTRTSQRSRERQQVASTTELPLHLRRVNVKPDIRSHAYIHRKPFVRNSARKQGLAGDASNRVFLPIPSSTLETYTVTNLTPWHRQRTPPNRWTTNRFVYSPSRLAVPTPEGEYTFRSDSTSPFGTYPSNTYGQKNLQYKESVLAVTGLNAPGGGNGLDIESSVETLSTVGPPPLHDPRLDHNGQHITIPRESRSDFINVTRQNPEDDIQVMNSTKSVRTSLHKRRLIEKQLRDSVSIKRAKTPELTNARRLQRKRTYSSRENTAHHRLTSAQRERLRQELIRRHLRRMQQQRQLQRTQGPERRSSHGLLPSSRHGQTASKSLSTKNHPLSKANSKAENHPNRIQESTNDFVTNGTNTVNSKHRWRQKQTKSRHENAMRDKVTGVHQRGINQQHERYSPGSQKYERGTANKQEKQTLQGNAGMKDSDQTFRNHFSQDKQTSPEQRKSLPVGNENRRERQRFIKSDSNSIFSSNPEQDSRESVPGKRQATIHSKSAQRTSQMLRQHYPHTNVDRTEIRNDIAQNRPLPSNEQQNPSRTHTDHQQDQIRNKANSGVERFRSHVFGSKSGARVSSKPAPTGTTLGKQQHFRGGYLSHKNENDNKIATTQIKMVDLQYPDLTKRSRAQKNRGFIVLDTENQLSSSVIKAKDLLTSSAISTEQTLQILNKLFFLHKNSKEKIDPKLLEKMKLLKSEYEQKSLKLASLKRHKTNVYPRQNPDPASSMNLQSSSITSTSKALKQPMLKHNQGLKPILDAVSLSQNLINSNRQKFETITRPVKINSQRIKSKSTLTKSHEDKQINENAAISNKIQSKQTRSDRQSNSKAVNTTPATTKMFQKEISTLTPAGLYAETPLHWHDSVKSKQTPNQLSSQQSVNEKYPISRAPIIKPVRLVNKHVFDTKLITTTDLSANVHRQDLSNHPQQPDRLKMKKKLNQVHQTVNVSHQHELFFKSQFEKSTLPTLPEAREARPTSESNRADLNTYLNSTRPSTNFHKQADRKYSKSTLRTSPLQNTPTPGSSIIQHHTSATASAKLPFNDYSSLTMKLTTKGKYTKPPTTKNPNLTGLFKNMSDGDFETMRQGQKDDFSKGLKVVTPSVSEIILPFVISHADYVGRSIKLPTVKLSNPHRNSSFRKDNKLFTRVLVNKDMPSVTESTRRRLADNKATLDRPFLMKAFSKEPVFVTSTPLMDPITPAGTNSYDMELQVTSPPPRMTFGSNSMLRTSSLKTHKEADLMLKINNVEKVNTSTRDLRKEFSNAKPKFSRGRNIQRGFSKGMTAVPESTNMNIGLNWRHKTKILIKARLLQFLIKRGKINPNMTRSQILKLIKKALRILTARLSSKLKIKPGEHGNVLQMHGRHRQNEFNPKRVKQDLAKETFNLDKSRGLTIKDLRGATEALQPFSIVFQQTNTHKPTSSQQPKHMANRNIKEQHTGVLVKKPVKKQFASLRTIANMTSVLHKLKELKGVLLQRNLHRLVTDAPITIISTSGKSTSASTLSPAKSLPKRHLVNLLMELRKKLVMKLKKPSFEHKTVSLSQKSSDAEYSNQSYETTTDHNMYIDSSTTMKDVESEDMVTLIPLTHAESTTPTPEVSTTSSSVKDILYNAFMTVMKKSHTPEDQLDILSELLKISQNSLSETTPNDQQERKLLHSLIKVAIDDLHDEFVLTTPIPNIPVRSPAPDLESTSVQKNFDSSVSTTPASETTGLDSSESLNAQLSDLYDEYGIWNSGFTNDWNKPVTDLPIAQTLTTPFPQTVNYRQGFSNVNSPSTNGRARQALSRLRAERDRNNDLYLDPRPLKKYIPVSNQLHTQLFHDTQLAIHHNPSGWTSNNVVSNHVFKNLLKTFKNKSAQVIWKTNSKPYGTDVKKTTPKSSLQLFPETLLSDKATLKQQVYNSKSTTAIPSLPLDFTPTNYLELLPTQKHTAENAEVPFVHQVLTTTPLTKNDQGTAFIPVPTADIFRKPEQSTLSRNDHTSHSPKMTSRTSHAKDVSAKQFTQPKDTFDGSTSAPIFSTIRAAGPPHPAIYTGKIQEHEISSVKSPESVKLHKHSTMSQVLQKESLTTPTAFREYSRAKLIARRFSKYFSKLWTRNSIKNWDNPLSTATATTSRLSSPKTWTTTVNYVMSTDLPSGRTYSNQHALDSKKDTGQIMTSKEFPKIPTKFAPISGSYQRKKHNYKPETTAPSQILYYTSTLTYPQFIAGTDSTTYSTPMVEMDFPTRTNSLNHPSTSSGMANEIFASKTIPGVASNAESSTQRSPMVSVSAVIHNKPIDPLTVNPLFNQHASDSQKDRSKTVNIPTAFHNTLSKDVVLNSPRYMLNGTFGSPDQHQMSTINYDASSIEHHHAVKNVSTDSVPKIDAKIPKNSHQSIPGILIMESPPNVRDSVMAHRGSLSLPGNYKSGKQSIPEALFPTEIYNADKYLLTTPATPTVASLLRDAREHQTLSKLFVNQNPTSVATMNMSIAKTHDVNRQATISPHTALNIHYPATILDTESHSHVSPIPATRMSLPQNVIAYPTNTYGPPETVNSKKNLNSITGQHTSISKVVTVTLPGTDRAITQASTVNSGTYSKHINDVVVPPRAATISSIRISPAKTGNVAMPPATVSEPDTTELSPVETVVTYPPTPSVFITFTSSQDVKTQFLSDSTPDKSSSIRNVVKYPSIKTGTLSPAKNHDVIKPEPSSVLHAKQDITVSKSSKDLPNVPLVTGNFHSPGRIDKDGTPVTSVLTRNKPSLPTANSIARQLTSVYVPTTNIHSPTRTDNFVWHLPTAPVINTSTPVPATTNNSKRLPIISLPATNTPSTTIDSVFNHISSTPQPVIHASSSERISHIVKHLRLPADTLLTNHAVFPSRMGDAVKLAPTTIKPQEHLTVSAWIKNDIYGLNPEKITFPHAVMSSTNSLTKMQARTTSSHLQILPTSSHLHTLETQKANRTITSGHHSRNSKVVPIAMPNSNRILNEESMDGFGSSSSKPIHNEHMSTTEIPSYDTFNSVLNHDTTQKPSTISIAADDKSPPGLGVGAVETHVEPIRLLTAALFTNHVTKHLTTESVPTFTSISQATGRSSSAANQNPVTKNDILTNHISDATLLPEIHNDVEHSPSSVFEPVISVRAQNSITRAPQTETRDASNYLYIASVPVSSNETRTIQSSAANAIPIPDKKIRYDQSSATSFSTSIHSWTRTTPSSDDQSVIIAGPITSHHSINIARRFHKTASSVAPFPVYRNISAVNNQGSIQTPTPLLPRNYNSRDENLSVSRKMKLKSILVNSHNNRKTVHSKSLVTQPPWPKFTASHSEISDHRSKMPLSRYPTTSPTKDPVFNLLLRRKQHQKDTNSHAKQLKTTKGVQTYSTFLLNSNYTTHPPGINYRHPETTELTPESALPLAPSMARKTSGIINVLGARDSDSFYHHLKGHVSHSGEVKMKIPLSHDSSPLMQHDKNIKIEVGGSTATVVSSGGIASLYITPSRQISSSTLSTTQPSDLSQRHSTITSDTKPERISLAHDTSVSIKTNEKPSSAASPPSTTTFHPTTMALPSSANALRSSETAILTSIVTETPNEPTTSEPTLATTSNSLSSTATKSQSQTLPKSPSSSPMQPLPLNNGLILTVFPTKVTGIPEVLTSVHSTTSPSLPLNVPPTNHVLSTITSEPKRQSTSATNSESTTTSATLAMTVIQSLASSTSRLQPATRILRPSEHKVTPTTTVRMQAGLAAPKPILKSTTNTVSSATTTTQSPGSSRRPFSNTPMPSQQTSTAFPKPSMILPPSNANATSTPQGEMVVRIQTAGPKPTTFLRSAPSAATEMSQEPITTKLQVLKSTIMSIPLPPLTKVSLMEETLSALPSSASRTLSMTTPRSVASETSESARIPSPSATFPSSVHNISLVSSLMSSLPQKQDQLSKATLPSVQAYFQNGLKRGRGIPSTYAKNDTNAESLFTKETYAARASDVFQGTQGVHAHDLQHVISSTPATTEAIMPNSFSANTDEATIRTTWAGIPMRRQSSKTQGLEAPSTHGRTYNSLLSQIQANGLRREEAVMPRIDNAVKRLPVISMLTMNTHSPERADNVAKHLAKPIEDTSPKPIIKSTDFVMTTPPQKKKQHKIVSLRHRKIFARKFAELSKVINETKHGVLRILASNSSATTNTLVRLLRKGSSTKGSQSQVSDYAQNRIPTILTSTYPSSHFSDVASTTTARLTITPSPRSRLDVVTSTITPTTQVPTSSHERKSLNNTIFKNPKVAHTLTKILQTIVALRYTRQNRSESSINSSTPRYPDAHNFSNSEEEDYSDLYPDSKMHKDQNGVSNSTEDLGGLSPNVTSTETTTTVEMTTTSESSSTTAEPQSSAEASNSDGTICPAGQRMHCGPGPRFTRTARLARLRRLCQDRCSPKGYCDTRLCSCSCKHVLDVPRTTPESSDDS